MFDNMRRLHPRGPANRGICVDADGAMLGPDCILVEQSLGSHRPIGRRGAALIQGLLLTDHRDPDWLFEQCGRIARALDNGQVALAQIYGLHIPIDELSDRRLGQLYRITAFAKTGFNPDEPRIPKGNPHGGEWTDKGDDEGGSGSSSGPVPDAGGFDGDGDDDSSGSSASPTPSDLGAGDSDSGGDGDRGDGTTGGSSDRVPPPAPMRDAGDAPPQSPTGEPASSSPTTEPAIEYIIVEPESSVPAGASSPTIDTTAPASGTPTPLDSADLDYQVAPSAGVPATTEPTSGAGPEAANESAPSAPNAQKPPADLQPLEPAPQVPAQRPQTTQQINVILRSTAIWLARAATILGPLFSFDPRVRLVWMALDAIGWLAENSPKIDSYLDGPKSLRQLRDAVDNRGPGYEIHHIVEAQRWSENADSNWKRFPGRINSRQNLVRVPYWKHVEISSWYSRPNPRFGDLTPRNYLRGKSWEEQYQTGLQVLRDEGVLQ